MHRNEEADYELLLTWLHQMIGDGQGDTPQADEIRDRMEVFERKFTAEEYARFERLSAELNRMHDGKEEQ